MEQNQFSCAERHKDRVMSLKGQKPRSRLLFGEYMNKTYLQGLGFRMFYQLQNEKLPFLRSVTTQFDKTHAFLHNNTSQNQCCTLKVDISETFSVFTHTYCFCTINSCTLPNARERRIVKGFVLQRTPLRLIINPCYFQVTIKIFFV